MRRVIIALCVLAAVACEASPMRLLMARHRAVAAGGVSETAFITTWQTTSSPQSITLPLRSGQTYNLTVDWGDGSALGVVTVYNDGDATHEYATAGTYTNTIEGTMASWSFNNGGSKAAFRTVSQWGDVSAGVLGIFAGFYGASGATAFATPVPTAWDDVTNLQQAWRGLTSLTAAPAISNLTKVTSLNQTWYDCTGLTAAPDVSALTNVTYLGAAWNGCNNVNFTNAPDVSALTKVNNLEQAWYGCNKLTSAPDVSALTLVTTLTETWRGCAVMTNAPDVSALTKVTVMSGAWRACWALTNAPAVNTLTNVTQMAYAWRDCYNLTSAPDISNLTKVINIANAWYDCKELATVPALPTASTALTTTTDAFRLNASMGGTVVELWDTNNFPNITAFGNTFTGCTNLTNYGDIPNNWKGL